MPAQNSFSPQAASAAGSNWPGLDLVAITPDNSNDLARVVRDIRVGGDGDVVVVTTSGTEVTFSNCVAGEHLGPFFVARVKVAGNPATGLVGYI